MHEMSIATGILDSALAAAAEHGAARIVELDVELGVMRLVVPEALRMAFEVIAEGTAAEGARLKLTEVGLRGRCVPCGREFEPEVDNYLCPACGQADVDIFTGNDIILKSVVCQTEEGDASP